MDIDGVEPSADFLGRIRRGEVGGVILFAPNITTAAGVTALTGRLREAAIAGGQPPLLIAVDQEGGIASGLARRRRRSRRRPWAATAGQALPSSRAP